jgi:octanoyl-[GcvH]:protein N-octanoyltransferase
LTDISSNAGTVRFVDDTGKLDVQDPLWNHALDEAIANVVANGMQPPTIRCWRYHQAVMLGRRDTKLPNLPDAIRWVCSQGYDVAVRPCGGTGVPLTKDVLNVSYLFPAADYIQYPLNTAFRAIAKILVHALTPIAKVDIGEVRGSYCPGDFDLSIQGFKISGIAQRRIKGAVILQAYILVGGEGEALFTVMQSLYEKAGYYTLPESQRPLPLLDPQTNRSIQEVTHANLRPEDIAQQILSAIPETLALPVYQDRISPEEQRRAQEERRRFQEVLNLGTYSRCGNS